MSRISARIRWVGRFSLVLGMLAGVYVVASSLLSGDDADRCRSIEIEIRTLQTVNQNISRTNEALARRIHALRHDDRVVEQIAREELGMIRADETLFLFPPEFSEQYASLD